MFVYVGGESDKWVEDVLASAENEDMVVINLLDVLGDSVKNEEIVEGMEHEHEEGGPEYDEHVWLSLRNAATLTGYISEQLQKIDENICMCQEFRDQIADPNFEGYCHCRLYYKEK